MQWALTCLPSQGKFVAVSSTALVETSPMPGCNRHHQLFGRCHSLSTYTATRWRHWNIVCCNSPWPSNAMHNQARNEFVGQDGGSWNTNHWKNSTCAQVAEKLNNKGSAQFDYIACSPPNYLCKQQRKRDCSKALSGEAPTTGNPLCSANAWKAFVRSRWRQCVIWGSTIVSVFTATLIA